MTPRNSQLSSPKSPQDLLGSKGILVGAAALMAYGITRRSKTSLALATAGGLLALNASRSGSNSQSAHTRATFLVNASPEKAYELFHPKPDKPRA